MSDNTSSADNNISSYSLRNKSFAKSPTLGVKLEEAREIMKGLDTI